MRIDFDERKSNKNIIERDLSFEDASEFDWASAVYVEDDRKIYPER